MLEDPGGKVTAIVETDVPGVWKADDTTEKRLSFGRDDEGAVVSMDVTEIVELPRVGVGSHLENHAFFTEKSNPEGCDAQGRVR